MDKQEIYDSYKLSLKLSLTATTAFFIGLGTLVLANNQDAIFLFFYEPIIVVLASVVSAFIAIPFLTITANMLRGLWRHSVYKV